MIHSFIKFWSGNIGQTLASENSAPFTGKCTSMTISSYYSSSTSIAVPTSYVIICPYEGTFPSSSLTTAGNYFVNLANWKWTDYYGLNAPIGAHLRYLWSNKEGILVGYLAEKKEGQALGECELGSAENIFALNTSQSKAQISMTLLSSIELKKKTSTGKDKEKMIIQLMTNSNTNAKLTSYQCSSGLAKIKCSVIKSSDNIFDFTLSNIDKYNDQTIPQAMITLTFWISSSSTSQENLYYTANIYGYFYLNYPLQSGATTKVKLNTCQNQESWSSTSAESKQITVNNPTMHCQVKYARSSFEFTFSTDYDVLDISKFVIDLSYLATINEKLKNNLRCAIYQYGVLSHSIKKFDISAFPLVTISLKQIETLLLKPTELGEISFNLKCFGAQMAYFSPNSSQQITIANQDENSFNISEGSSTNTGNLFNNFLTVNSNSSIASITFNRQFDSIGQDATYTFKIIVQPKILNAETNETAIRFGAGSKFYIEFARDIAPKFNKLGILRCYHETYPTICTQDGERRIILIARTELNHNLTYGHNFSVVGVSIPQNFDYYSVMYFALVPAGGQLKNMEFQNNKTSDSAPADITVTTLPVVYYQQESMTQIRSTYSFQMHIKFPTSSINENIPLWIDFPEEYDETFFIDWSPVCKLQNIKINVNDSIENYVSYCVMHSIRRMQIVLLTDTSNREEKLYNLTVSYIPTYNNEQIQLNVPLVWIGSEGQISTPLYKTNLGYFNATNNLKKFLFTDSQTKQLLNWNENSLTCYIGAFSCEAELKINRNSYFNYDINSITASGSYEPYFSFNPSIIQAKIGKSLSIKIAPKIGIYGGVYQITWDHDATDYYSKIPPLNLNVLNSKLDLSLDESNYEIPNGGQSLPLIFSFANKMPEKDLTITGSAWIINVNDEGNNEYQISPYVSFEQSSQNITFNESSSRDTIYFILNGKQTSGDIETIILWNLTGSNADCYETPDSITIKVVDSTSLAPQLTLESPNTANQIGTMEIFPSCSQLGNFYYIVSQDKNQTDVDFSVIMNITKSQGIFQTDLGTIIENPSKTIYGFLPNLIVNQSTVIKFDEKLESEATYYMRIYCVNQFNQSSNAEDVSWKQESNSGKPLVVSMQFQKNVSNSSNMSAFESASLNDNQRQQLACLICEFTANEKDRVRGKGGISCNDVQESQNTTLRQLFSSDISNNRFLGTFFNITEYFILTPNLFRADGDLSDAKTLLESPSFQQLIESQQFLNEYTLSSTISCSINTNYPLIPEIQSPFIITSINSFVFTWTGANNTDGFIYLVVLDATNMSSIPEAIQIKKYPNGKAFYSKESVVSIVVKNLEECKKYNYFWLATNEYPETYQFNTEIFQGNASTGCETIYAQRKRFDFIILIFLIFYIIF